MEEAKTVVEREREREKDLGHQGAVHTNYKDIWREKQRKRESVCVCERERGM